MPDCSHLAGQFLGFVTSAALPICANKDKRTELLAHRENPPHQPSNRPIPALSGAGRTKNMPVRARVSRISPENR
jgi:hypothetical protein